MALMEVNFFSKALMRPVTMNVILPADKVFFGEETEEENKPFKTLYLLHGVMGNYTDWVTGTCIKRWAEEKNLAVVMPSGANMFYMDHPNANENYSEFIGKELVKITRRMFPLSHKKEDTFIAGLSMGGYGAIRNGLKYHDTFGYIAGLSSAMILEKMGTADDSSPMFFEKKSFLESVFGDLSRIKDCEINPEWIAENMPCIIEAWEPGVAGGQALAEILYGKVNPSGKLPITIPRSTGQIQCMYNHKFTNHWFPYATGNSLPLYEFGYGLSYTTYKYDNLKLSEAAITPDKSVEVTIDVTNTGKMDGEETVQLYIRDEYSSATRPVKELKDFARIPLKAGETKQVSFTLTPEMLSYYDADMHYGVEKGTFKIMVGASSRDTDLQSVILTVK